MKYESSNRVFLIAFLLLWISGANAQKEETKPPVSEPQFNKLQDLIQDLRTHQSQDRNPQSQDSDHSFQDLQPMDSQQTMDSPQDGWNPQSELPAQITWYEPQVVPERLVRRNRQVLRFSGMTSPNAKIRIRENKIGLTLNDGTSRMVRIPQKNINQFPLVADSDGSFSFDLYLPTTFVEIPVEVKAKGTGDWALHTKNYQVPDKDSSHDLHSIEQSFQTQDQGKIPEIEKDANYYSSQEDQGMLLKDRNFKKTNKKGSVRVWAGLGGSYFKTSVASKERDYNRSGSTFAIPIWRFGLDWDFSKKFHFRGNLHQLSGNTTNIGSAPEVSGSEFSWLEFQTSLLWFSDMLDFSKMPLAIDVGFKYQSLPFFRQRSPNFINFAYHDNSLYSFYLGLFHKGWIDKNKTWNYEFYGRYIYPISSGNNFQVDSSVPINYEFGGLITMPLSPGFSLGFDSQFHILSTNVKYEVDRNLEVPSGLDLILFTLGARLIVDF